MKGKEGPGEKWMGRGGYVWSSEGTGEERSTDSFFLRPPYPYTDWSPNASGDPNSGLGW